MTTILTSPYIGALTGLATMGRMFEHQLRLQYAVGKTILEANPLLTNAAPMLGDVGVIAPPVSKPATRPKPKTTATTKPKAKATTKSAAPQAKAKPQTPAPKRPRAPSKPPTMPEPAPAKPRKPAAHKAAKSRKPD